MPRTREAPALHAYQAFGAWSAAPFGPSVVGAVRDVRRVGACAVAQVVVNERGRGHWGAYG